MTNRIPHIFSAVLILLVACSRTEQAPQVISIIPQPASVQAAEGVFKLDRKTTIYVESGDSSLVRTFAFLNERLLKAAGFSLPIIVGDPLQYGGEKGIFVLNAGLKQEAYHLRISPDRVVVDYGDGAGAFYAVQTILQLLPVNIFASERQRGVKWDLPCCDIEDAPRFPYRGMHLDCCLHFSAWTSSRNTLTSWPSTR